MRTVDPSVEREINSISPRNTFGEPVYRAIWSADVLHWVAGWWINFEKTTGLILGRVWEARQVPRYQSSARWMIEKWLAPETFGTREQWEIATQIVCDQNPAEFKAGLELGPYPERGMYASIWTCSDADGGYMNLTPEMARIIVKMSMQPVASAMLLQSLHKQRLQKQDADFNNYVENFLHDMFPFGGSVSNLSSRSLMDKVRDENKAGKEILR